VYEVYAKSIFGGNVYVRYKFSCVRSFHDLCAHKHTHNLEGTLIERYGFKSRAEIYAENSPCAP